MGIKKIYRRLSPKELFAAFIAPFLTVPMAFALVINPDPLPVPGKVFVVVLVFLQLVIWINAYHSVKYDGVQELDEELIMDDDGEDK